MPTPVCTDEHFIKVWKAHNGETEKVREALGCNLRNVYR
jgi:hypothetical protein